MKKAVIILLIFLVPAFLVQDALAQDALNQFMTQQIMINEIMYNPEGTDNNNEFIELYSTEILPDLSGWMIGDAISNDTLVLLNNFTFFDHWSDDFTSFYSALIVEEGFNYSGLDEIPVYSTGATIGNNLNDEDIIYLYSLNRTLIDSVSYNSSFQASNNGKTICLFNNTWQECSATPGKENVPIISINPIPSTKDNPKDSSAKEKELILAVYLDSEIYLKDTYTQLFKITIKNKEICSEKDHLMIDYFINGSDGLVKGSFTKDVGCSSYASTGEFTPAKIGNYTLCGKISSVKDSELICQEFKVIDPLTISCDFLLQMPLVSNNGSFIYKKGESVKFKPVLSSQIFDAVVNNSDDPLNSSLSKDSFPFTITYWIEDLFGNVVKKKYDTTNTNQKSWKTNLDEEDRVFWIKAKVVPGCNDINLTNNDAETLFIVTRPLFSTNVVEEETLEQAVETDSDHQDATLFSSLKITKVSPTAISFGKNVLIGLEIYKGNTNKYSISAWIEKNGKIITEKTKINLMNKNILYKVTLPLLLKPNCDLKIDEGRAKIVIEGLGETTTQSISISGINKALCKNEVMKEPSQKMSESKKSKKTTSSQEVIEQDEETLSILSTLSQNDKEESLFLELGKNFSNNLSDEMIIYESNNAKAVKFIPTLLAVTFALISLALVFKINSKT